MKLSNLSRITALIIIGIMISYVMQMGPSPLLILLRDEFHLAGRDALLNLCVSVIFPFLILGSLIGSSIEQRTNTSVLFAWCLIFLSTGIIGNFFVIGFIDFLIYRAIFGLGFGLGIPFIGSAIMRWYKPKQRDSMTTINGLFPFIATLVAFCTMLPLSHLFGNSWRAAFGVWGILAVAVLVLWKLTAHASQITTVDAIDDSTSAKGLYRDLLRRKPVVLLSVIFVCDFFCYSYIATVLPIWLFELGGVSETAANILAAVAFPLLGLVGCLSGGLFSAKCGLRKPPLVIGQLLKLIGLITASLTGNLWFSVFGVAVFAFGNGLWMPSMYSIPTELDGMNATRVGAAFALMSASGFAVGFVSPVIGGLLTQGLAAAYESIGSVSAHVMGLRWSVFIFSFLNIFAFVSAVCIRETGSRRRN